MIMKKTNKFLIVLFTAGLLGACEQYQLPEIEAPATGSAGLDLTKMVSVGNSLTAGFMNNALYTASQNNSYPSIMAKQFALAGGGAFNQPDINSVNGFSGTSGTTILGRLRLRLVNGSPSPVPLTPGDIPGAFTGNKAALNNFGVPGVTLQTAQIPQLGGPATGNPAFNALYARFASNPGQSTLIGDAKAAMANGGTFFTFWLGNNDVLGYATGGAANPAILTSQADFATRFNAALNEMLNAKPDAEGAVANIPNVTSIPYFTTVAWNPVVFLSTRPVDVGTVAQLNGAAAYGGFNAALSGLVAAGRITAADADRRRVVFRTGANATAGANGVVIIDESLPDIGPFLNAISPALAPFGRVRQATAADLIVLPAASILPTGVGVSSPMPDQWVLIPAEQAEIQTAIDGFNATIASVVNAQNRLVLVDANKALVDLRAGRVSVRASALTASILPPFGAFSLDGVHPNARGSAYIANLFIDAINAKWGSTIPRCNPNDFSGNELPQ